MIFDHKPGKCHNVEGIEWGSEDMEMIDGDRALITSGLQWTEDLKALFGNRRGQIFLFDFRKPEVATPVEIIGGLDMKSFNPHGMSIWNDGQGIKIFVVNHPLDSAEFVDQVEIFTWNDKTTTLVHEKSVKDPEFRQTNDVAATGPDSFYITNHLHNVDPFGRVWETLSLLSWGSVVHHDGNNGTVVTKNLKGPNGVSMNQDGSRVYVPETVTGLLKVFSRASDNSLKLLNTIPINSGMDNLWIEPDTGAIWAGCSPIIYRALPHMMNPLNNPAPSQVLRIVLAGDMLVSVEEVFADSGLPDGVYSSSIALYNRKHQSMLVGSVMHKLTYCQVKHLGI